MAFEIVEVIVKTFQPVIRKAFVTANSDLLRPSKGESSEDFASRKAEGINGLITEGKAKWRGDPQYGDEDLDKRELLYIGKVNPAEFKMRTQAETNALSEARKDRVKADKEAKASA